MSQEINDKKIVDELKNDLKDLIDLRIEYNYGFANLLRGDYTFFLSLIALILSIYNALKYDIFTKYYALSVYLVIIIFWLSSFYNIKTFTKDLNKIKQADPENVTFDVDDIPALYSIIRPIYYPLWILPLLNLFILWHIEDFRGLLWLPSIILSLNFFYLSWKDYLFNSVIFLWFKSVLKIETKGEIEIKKLSYFTVLISLAGFILSLIFVLYYILIELYLIMLKDPNSILIVILSMIILTISFGFLSEYMSMKYMVTEISNQNEKLMKIRIGIDGFEGVEELKNHKKELLKLYLPKADSFLFFFNYYHLQLTKSFPTRPTASHGNGNTLDLSQMFR